jgi:2-isopropylmalate synthase
MSETVIFLDTTLRVHEPSSGIDLSLDDKVEIALLLAGAGVDVIEVGEPAASPAHEQAVRRVASEVRTARISAIAPCEPRAIELCAAALGGARESRLHVYLLGRGVERSGASSKEGSEAIALATSMVRMARNLAADVEFSLVDATRADPGFFAELVRGALSAGATTVNVPDVGFILPNDLASWIARLCHDVPEIEHAVLSFHGHDDLGLATANALAAVRSGARQVEGAVNGLGGSERNTALEEVALTLRVHGDRLGVGTRVDLRRLRAASELVEKRTGVGARPSRWWEPGS